MTAELSHLARRAVACRAWRWMPGMRVVVPPPHNGATGYMVRVKGNERGGVAGYPDLTDPATLGCLLYLVREAHGDVVWLHYDCGVWVVCGLPEDPGGSATEAEALVVALEAAP